MRFHSVRPPSGEKTCVEAYAQRKVGLAAAMTCGTFLSEGKAYQPKHAEFDAGYLMGEALSYNRS